MRKRIKSRIAGCSPGLAVARSRLQSVSVGRLTVLERRRCDFDASALHFDASTASISLAMAEQPVAGPSRPSRPRRSAAPAKIVDEGAASGSDDDDEPAYKPSKDDRLAAAQAEAADEAEASESRPSKRSRVSANVSDEDEGSEPEPEEPEAPRKGKGKEK